MGLHVFSKKIMRVMSRRVFIAVVLALLLLYSPTPSRADTTVCGPITSNTTWTPAGNDYIVSCNVQVVSGVTLLIQPETVVKFDADTSLIVDGELIAMGATFTTSDTFTNPYDWDHILFNPSSVDAVFDAQGNYVSGSTIQGSIIEFGGGGSSVDGAIEIDVAAPYIFNNTVRLNGVSGINAVGASQDQPVIVEQNSVVDNSGDGVSITNGQAISNTISNNDGGGIEASNSLISANTISGNVGGIDASGSVITENTINGNIIGGGITASGSTITDNTISGNSKVFCGGVDAKGNTTVTNNSITNNSTTSVSGGGLCLEGGMATDNTITGNATTDTGGGVYAIDAVVENNLVTNNSASLGGGIYGVDGRISNNIIDGNNATSDGGGIYAEGQTTVTNNDVSNNSSAQGGGIYSLSSFSGVPSLTGNTVQDNEANSGGGIYSVESITNGNTVMSNTAQSEGGGIFGEGGTMTNNTVSANSVPSWGHGSGAYLVGVTDFTYNDVLTNTASGGTAGGISIEGQPQIHNNNLYDNLPYDAEVITSQDVDGTLNYWGASACTAIPMQIYDGNDSPGRGKLAYAPSLYLPSPVAQLSAPEDLTLTEGQSSVTLNWTPLPDIPNIGCRPPGSSTPDLIYRIYYDTDSACPPFDGIGLPAGDSPISAGTNTQITLSGASQDGFVFTVTAQDYLERESTYSNIVGNLPLEGSIFLPSLFK